MKRTLKYFCSLLLLLPILVKGQDSTQFINSIGFTIDLSRIAVQFFEKDRNVISGYFDVQFKDKFYLNLELGYQTVDIKKDFYKYYSSGIYTRFGISKEIIRSPDSDKSSSGYGSLRYCYSNFNQEASDIHYVNTYWGNKTAAIEKNNYGFHWIELGGGLNAMIFRNFYIGWAIFVRIAIVKPDYDMVTPYNVPGFGKGTNNPNMGFSYSVSYRIPFK